MSKRKPAPSSSAAPSDVLPYTGAPLAIATTIGAALAAAGATITAAARRRKDH